MYRYKGAAAFNLPYAGSKGVKDTGWQARQPGRSPGAWGGAPGGWGEGPDADQGAN